MKTIVVGVMLQEQIRARAIAKGEYKPKLSEPKIWFTSMRSVAEVLSDQNRATLKVIRESSPDSIAVLAKATGRRPGNLSRTLKSMWRASSDPGSRLRPGARLLRRSVTTGRQGRAAACSLGYAGRTGSA